MRLYSLLFAFPDIPLLPSFVSQELASSVAHLLCRSSHGAPLQSCVAYAQARVRAFLDVCANGCQDEEEADPR